MKYFNYIFLFESLERSLQKRFFSRILLWAVTLLSLSAFAFLFFDASYGPYEEVKLIEYILISLWFSLIVFNFVFLLLLKKACFSYAVFVGGTVLRCFLFLLLQLLLFFTILLINIFFNFPNAELISDYIANPDHLFVYYYIQLAFGLFEKIRIMMNSNKVPGS